MNIKDVKKRELLDFKAFRAKVHDETFKPLAPKNQTDSSDKTGLHKIKREPAYDFVGYAEAVFGKKSKIDLPGYNNDGNREYSIDNAAPSIVNQPNSITMTESEKVPSELSKIKRLSDFDIEADPETEEISEESDPEITEEDIEELRIQLNDVTEEGRGESAYMDVRDDYIVGWMTDNGLDPENEDEFDSILDKFVDKLGTEATQ